MRRLSAGGAAATRGEGTVGRVPFRRIQRPNPDRPETGDGRYAHGRAAPMGGGQPERASTCTVVPVWGASTISPSPR